MEKSTNSLIVGLSILILLPQISFAATSPNVDPQTKAFIAQQDAESVAFFTGQAQERAIWFKAHADVITKLDQYGRSELGYEKRKHDARVKNEPFAETPPTVVTDSTYAAFQAHQLSDGQVFLAKIAKEKQQFLSSSGTTTTEDTTTTPITTTPTTK